jgi:hypothetical protein
MENKTTKITLKVKIKIDVNRSFYIFTIVFFIIIISAKKKIKR